MISDYRNTPSVRPEAEVFLALAQRGFAITIMTYAEAEYAARFRESGMTVIDFHPQKKFDKQEISFIKKELKKGYDIAFFFNGPAMINGVQAVKGVNVKTVLYRGLSGTVNVEWWNPGAHLKYLSPRVDAIWCNTNGVVETIPKFLKKTRRKAWGIPKGQRSEWFADIQPIDRKKLGLSEDDFLVINVANNRTMKDIPTLLKSSRFLPSDLPIHFLLVGRDMDTKQNLKIIEKSPNSDKIHLLGWRKDRLEIVAASDVFALTSITGEAITKSVIEAMCLETAPIITAIPGNAELVENGVSGFKIPLKKPKVLAEQILELYLDKNLLKKIEKNAKVHIDKNLNHFDTIDKVEKMCRKLVSC